MIAQVVRSGVVEATHQGAVVAIGPNGEVIASYGDVERRYFARSAVKPFQVFNSLRFGGGMPQEYVAVASASHGGDPVHVAIAEAILADAGLNESELQCPPAWPLAPPTARRVGGEKEPRRIWHNCSGKHAAMLRACVRQGWPTDSYVASEHPLQQANFDLIAEVTEEDPGPVGVDGCGVPAFQISTIGIARAFARLASDRRMVGIWRVMHRFPMLVSAIDGNDAAIGRAIDAAAKRGAEGLLGVAIRNQAGIAVKAWDGASRAAGVGMIAALDQLGFLTSTARSQLASTARPDVLGGGAVVGSVVPSLRLER